MASPAGSCSARCLISGGLLTSITWRPLREEWSWKWQEGEQVITREQSCQALFIFMPSKTSATDRRCRPLCHGGMSVAHDGKAAVSQSALARDPQITHLGPWKTHAVILPPRESSQKAGMHKTTWLIERGADQRKAQHSPPGLPLTLRRPGPGR